MYFFATDWMECMDNTTGYPYFWNRKTNEVRWDRPDGIAAQATKVPEKKLPAKAATILSARIVRELG